MNNNNNHKSSFNTQPFQKQSVPKLLPYSQYLKQKKSQSTSQSNPPPQIWGSPNKNCYQNNQTLSNYQSSFNHQKSYNYQYTFPQQSMPFYSPYQNQYPTQNFQYYPPTIKPQENYRNQKNSNQQKVQTPKKEQKPQQNRYQSGSSKKYQSKSVVHNRNSSFDKRSQQKLQDYEQSQYSSDNSSSGQFGRFTIPKRKIVRKDPVLDSPEQIRKWIEARRKNYPRQEKQISQNQQQDKQLCNQMSILENRIRKKLQILNADPRSIMKKSKNMSVMKRILMNPHKTKRILKKRNQEARVIQSKYTISGSMQKIIQPPKSSDTLIKMQSKQQLSDQQQGEVQIVQPIQQQAEIQAEQNGSMKIQSQEQGHQIQSGQAPQQIPIVKQPIQKQESQLQQNYVMNTVHKKAEKRHNSENHVHSVLTPQEIISHLKQKQREDKQWANSLLSYKSNSLNYNYTCQSLEISLSLEQIFKESVYLLQAIRYMSKNNYFQN